MLAIFYGISIKNPPDNQLLLKGKTALHKIHPTDDIRFVHFDLIIDLWNIFRFNMVESMENGA